jgi:hypothetical protein
VTVEVAKCGVELYDKERDEEEVDSKLNILGFDAMFTLDHDISDTVLHMMDLASKIAEVEFSED